jgi:penicillin-binding protein 1A
MGRALKGVEEEPRAVPEGVIQARVNPETGLRVAGGIGGIVDYFYQEFVPALDDVAEQSSAFPGMPDVAKPPEEVKSQLF